MHPKHTWNLSLKQPTPSSAGFSWYLKQLSERKNLVMFHSLTICVTLAGML
jgi:hypothetical protein